MLTNRRVRCLARLLPGILVLAAANCRGEDGTSEPIKGIGPSATIQKVQSGFKFTEGPVTDSDGNLFFSDVPESKTYKLDAQGKLSVFRAPSGNGNGLFFNAARELITCEMEGRLTATSADGKQTRIIVDQYEGKRFNAPNDLVVDSEGGVYFTDPHFRAPEPLPQGVTAVYYVTAKGEASRLLDDLKAPNGVILSPDEKTLYVIPSLQAEMMAYPVESPGKLGHGSVFCKLEQPQGMEGRGGDGLTIDVEGNLYITSGLGIQVFSSKGKPLGIIAFPEQPSNATFGGPDNKTLYVTARTSVYSAQMEVAGHRFPGGPKPKE